MDFKCPPVCYNVELSLMYTIWYVVLTYAKQTSENNHIKKMMIPLGQCKTIVPNLNSIFTSISYIRYWKRNTLLLYILFLFNNVSFIHNLCFSIKISSRFFLHTQLLLLVSSCIRKNKFSIRCYLCFWPVLKNKVVSCQKVLAVYILRVQP